MGVAGTPPPRQTHGARRALPDRSPHRMRSPSSLLSPRAQGAEEGEGESLKYTAAVFVIVVKGTDRAALTVRERTARRDRAPSRRRAASPPAAPELSSPRRTAPLQRQRSLLPHSHCWTLKERNFSSALTTAKYCPERCDFRGKSSGHFGERGAEAPSACAAPPSEPRSFARDPGMGVTAAPPGGRTCNVFLVQVQSAALN